MSTIKNSFLVAAVAGTLGLTAAGVVSARVVYRDNFARGTPSSPMALNGTKPSPTDTASATWAYTGQTNFNTNGTDLVVSSVTPSNNGDAAFLPLAPKYGDGQIISISVTETPTANSGDGDWLGFGFATSKSAFSVPTHSFAWILYRLNGGGQGFNNMTNDKFVNIDNAPYAAGTPVTFTTTLNDNTGAVSVTGNGRLLGTTTLTSTQVNSISYVFLSYENTATGNFSNFSVKKYRR